MSEESGAALARALHTSRYAVLREIGSEASLEMADTEKDAAVPAHPGVAAYIDGTERTFFERYSDVFWGTVLLLSGLGSARAWFRAFYYREELDDTATMRDRLLTLASDARAATANDKIVAMELSADAILRDVLDRYEDGAIDDGTLAAFGLALAHFRDVARARKVNFLSRPLDEYDQERLAQRGGASRRRSASQLELLRRFSSRLFPLTEAEGPTHRQAEASHGRQCGRSDGGTSPKHQGRRQNFRAGGEAGPPGQEGEHKDAQGIVM